MQGNMPHNMVSTERRKDPRKRPLSLVYVELSAANGGMLRDLSELGFAMRTMMPLRVGEITPFTFSLDATTRLEGRCKVLWVEEDGRVAGLQFTEVPGNLRAQVRAWLGAKQAYTAPPTPPAPTTTTSQASTLEELREELRTVVARPEVPDRHEQPLRGLHAETATAKEETHAAAFLEESSPDKLPEDIHSKSTPEAAAETVVVLESLPSLDPLPELDEAGFLTGGAKSAPWVSTATIALTMRILLVLALVAVAVVYHRPIGNAIVWLGLKIAGEDASAILPIPKSDISPPMSEGEMSPAASNTEVAAPSTPEKSSNDATAAKTTTAATEKKPVEVPPVMENHSPTVAKNPTSVSPIPLPATNKITPFTPPVGATTDAGQQEYVAAQDILKSKNPEAALPEAVRLLWVAVEKGNSNAEIALAELYRQGRGVAKNCDQTKILLTAAAKKGNAEAQKHLDQFLAEGCE